MGGRAGCDMIREALLFCEEHISLLEVLSETLHLWLEATKRATS